MSMIMVQCLTRGGVANVVGVAAVEVAAGAVEGTVEEMMVMKDQNCGRGVSIWLFLILCASIK